MRIVCGMTTFSREKAPTLLAQSVNSVLAAGFDQLHLFAWDDVTLGKGVYQDGVQVHRTRERLWPFQNFLFGLRTMLAVAPDADGYMIFQDDVVVAKNLRSWLDQSLWPDGRDDGLVSLYTPAILTDQLGGHHSGWFQMPMPAKDARQRKNEPHTVGTYGAQAILMSGKFARAFLKPRPDLRNMNKTDHWLARFCYENDLPYWHHDPSLVRHAGAKTPSFYDMPMDQWESHYARYRDCDEFAEDAATVPFPVSSESVTQTASATTPPTLSKPMTPAERRAARLAARQAS